MCVYLYYTLSITLKPTPFFARFTLCQEKVPKRPRLDDLRAKLSESLDLKLLEAWPN